MAGQVRRCAYILCSKPLPAASRSDKQFCCPAHKAAARRWRRHQAEAVAIGLWYTLGLETANVVRCPSCGRCFALGHGHRRDSIYDRPACRQAAYRARKAAERVREAVTAPSTVTDLGTRCTPVNSENATGKKMPTTTSG